MAVEVASKVVFPVTEFPSLLAESQLRRPALKSLDVALKMQEIQTWVETGVRLHSVERLKVESAGQVEVPKRQVEIPKSAVLSKTKVIERSVYQVCRPSTSVEDQRK